MAVPLLTTAVALPHSRQPNAIDYNTIQTPLAAIPAHFDRCRLLPLRQNAIVSQERMVY